MTFNGLKPGEAFLYKGKKLKKMNRKAAIDDKKNVFFFKGYEYVESVEITNFGEVYGSFV